MNNKKLGLLLICISLIFSMLVWGFNKQISMFQEEECLCQGHTCEEREKPSIIVHGSIVVVVATLSLGIYLIFFEKSEERIISQLERDLKKNFNEQKFQIFLKGLDHDEKKVISALKEQNGITQATLRLRTDLHKSKLSLVLSGLEKKSLVKKVASGRTNKIFMKIHL